VELFRKRWPAAGFIGASLFAIERTVVNEQHAPAFAGPRNRVGAVVMGAGGARFGKVGSSQDGRTSVPGMGLN